MCRTVLCRVLAPLSTLALLTVIAWPPVPVAASHAGAAARHGAPTVTVRRTRHILVYGSLMDSQPWHDQWLKVYTKTHQTNHYVEMMRSTVVKVKTKVVPRGLAPGEAMGGEGAEQQDPRNHSAWGRTVLLIGGPSGCCGRNVYSPWIRRRATRAMRA